MKKFIYILTVVLSMFIFIDGVSASTGTCRYNINSTHDTYDSSLQKITHTLTGVVDVKYTYGEKLNYQFTLSCNDGVNAQHIVNTPDYLSSLANTDFYVTTFTCPSILFYFSGCNYNKDTNTYDVSLGINKNQFGTAGTVVNFKEDVKEENVQNNEYNTCYYKINSYEFSLTYNDGVTVVSSPTGISEGIEINDKENFEASQFEGTSCPAINATINYNGTGNLVLPSSITVTKGNKYSAYKAINNKTGSETKLSSPFDIGGTISKEVNGCEYYLGKSSEEGTVAYILQVIYTVIKIGAIVLYIIFAMLDFAKVITDEKDILKTTISKQVKRLIILVLVLLLPFFLGVIGDLINFDITCGIK